MKIIKKNQCGTNCECSESIEKPGIQKDKKASQIQLQTPVRIDSEYTWKNRIGAWKARWGINRNNYSVDPGLYRIGNPDRDSHVFVTANYKLTYDLLRRELEGIDGWILVLDTKGVNVWCAAGKGTFGTEELIHRISKTGLQSYINHKKLIMPQLGAVGVSGFEITKRTGFQVIFGPVRMYCVKSQAFFKKVDNFFSNSIC